jgi:hypothetical protein
MCLAIPEIYKNVLSHISFSLRYGRENYLPMLVLAFILNTSKLSLRKLGQEILSEQRNKSNVCRIFNNSEFNTAIIYKQFYDLSFQQISILFSTPWLIIIDTTAKKTKRRWHRRKPNRGKGGKRRLRKRSSNCIKYKNKGKTGNGSQAQLWVMGLLITDTGVRIPLPRRSYHTKAYARKHGLKYRSQIDIAVEMLTRFRVPDNVEIFVVADSFFESKKLDRICKSRNFSYVTAVDSHRCLADEYGNSNGQHIVALFDALSSKAFEKITLNSDREEYYFFRRSSEHKNKKHRIYYVCKKTLNIAKLGERSVVFSKKVKNNGRNKSFSYKVILTNNDKLSAKQMVELYELRWEIELYFKELKSYLHFSDYDFEDFKASERWVDIVLITFLFLEYIRLQRFEKLKLSDTPKNLKKSRIPQLIEIVRLDVNKENISYLKEAIKSPFGRQNLLIMLSKYNLVA